MSHLEEIKQKDLRPPKAKDLKNFFNYENTYWHYYNTIWELYTTTFGWYDMPDYMYEEGADQYLETVLTNPGRALFFYDDILDKYLVGDFSGTNLNWYGYPTKYTVALKNGYTRTDLDNSNSVRIYNSSIRTNELVSIDLFAQKLATCDLILFINLHTQKVPYIIKSTTQNKLTWDNFLNELNSYNPNIIVNKDLDLDDFQILQTGAKYIGNDIIETKKQIWSEALSYVGVASSLEKRERLVVNEQQSFNADSNALLLTRLVPRQEACKNINKKFGLNMSVKVRQDLQLRVDMLSSQFYENISTVDSVKQEGGNLDG